MEPVKRNLSQLLELLARVEHDGPEVAKTKEDLSITCQQEWSDGSSDSEWDIETYVLSTCGGCNAESAGFVWGRGPTLRDACRDAAADARKSSRTDHCFSCPKLRERPETLPEKAVRRAAEVAFGRERDALELAVTKPGAGTTALRNFCDAPITKPGAGTTAISWSTLDIPKNMLFYATEYAATAENALDYAIRNPGTRIFVPREQYEFVMRAWQELNPDPATNERWQLVILPPEEDCFSNMIIKVERQ